MFIIFDIGGTNLRMASSIDGQTIDHIETRPTPQSYEAGKAAILELANKLMAGKAVNKLTGGVPGLLDENKTMLVKAWHLPDWAGKPLAKDLEESLNAPVSLENDTALGALGEAKHGAGKNYPKVMYVAIGTGLGGAWVINKKLVSGKFGFEPGHQIINFNNNTELESLASGSGLAAMRSNQYKEISEDELWESIGSPLSTGIYNTYLHWPSDIIVLGGGVMINSKLPIEKLKGRLAELLSFYPAIPELAITELGDHSGLYGALGLIA